MMNRQTERTHSDGMTDAHNGLALIVVLIVLLLLSLAGCGTGTSSSDGGTASTQLNLVANTAEQSQIASRVPQVARIEIEISGPDIATQTNSVPVSNPQSIDLTINAPLGDNRTIRVRAFDSGNKLLFSGQQGGITLPSASPITITVSLPFVLTVTVTKQGTANGTVTSSPAGIDCPGTCSNDFDAGESVTLTASASPGSIFTGWSGGGCSGTGPCALVMNSDQTVTATFAAAPSGTATLTVTKAGTGTGTVTSNVGGINCGPTCNSASGTFAIGTQVILTASPAAGSTFAGWSGGGCSGTAPCTVTVTGNVTVTATFNAVAPTTATLTVTKAGTGTGTVTSSPPGINCGNDCSNSYTIGTIVTLTASPAAGSVFVGWSVGGCGGTSCTVTMTGNQTVTATFSPVSMATLTVSKQGAGSGTVTSSPAGISCGNTCSAGFASGSAVTLTATAAAGSTFAGWSGGGCSGTGTCTTTMATNQTVVATFNVALVLRTLTVTRTGSGNGTVTSSPAGISCGAVCTFNFADGTVVTLTATPAAGDTFGGWSGGGGGNNNCNNAATCTLTMDRTRSISARFNP